MKRFSVFECCHFLGRFSHIFHRCFMKRFSVFECRSAPAVCICTGEPAGYSISILRNGDVVKREYLAHIDEPSEETIIANVPELSKIIRDIIKAYKNKLAVIPDILLNGSSDGGSKIFNFNGKEIATYNIRRHDLAEIMRCCKLSEKELASISDEIQGGIAVEARRSNDYMARVLMYENLILDVYNEIAREINRHVPEASLWIYE